GYPTQPAAQFYLQLFQKTVSVTGTVALGCADASQDDIVFEFRAKDGSGTFTRTIRLNPDGTYVLNNIPARLYDLAIKGSKWLRRTLPNVDATVGDLSFVDAALNPGDANNDNHVDIIDLGFLADHYNTSANLPDGPPDPGFDSQEDFNCDGNIDIV